MRSPASGRLTRWGADAAVSKFGGVRPLLAELSHAELAELFPAPSPADKLEVSEMRRRLAAVRRRGYGINDGLTERRVVAIGACVRGPDGRPVGAMCVSAPALRFQRRQFPEGAQVLFRQVALLEAELAHAAR